MLAFVRRWLKERRRRRLTREAIEVADIIERAGA